MGSGGSQPISWPVGSSASKMLSDAVSQTQRTDYEQEVNQYCSDLLRDFNDRDVDGISRHLDTIQNALGADVIGIKLLYAGSISKRTYVNGLSDIDMLAILNDSKLAKLSPDEVKKYFETKLRQHSSEFSEIRIGDLAITVRFKGTEHEFQILPAITTENGIRIADPKTGNWSNEIDPKTFAEKLTAVNQERVSRVVPVIKLFKALNEQLPEEAQLIGYHIESLAVEAFKSYAGRPTFKDMLVHLSNYSANAVRDPIIDSTGQSKYVDSYLGPKESIKRRKASAALNRICSRMRVADSAASLDEWKAMFGE